MSPGWYWVPSDGWTLEMQGDFDGSSKPMLRMDPPAGAVWAEVRIGFTDWPSDDTGRGGTTFVDDLIVDEFGLTFFPLDKLADAKMMTDGELISVEGKRVTAVPGAGIPANKVYVEEPDRSCGICVDLSACPGWAAEVGDKVSVRGGLLKTADGECYIQAFTFDSTASGSPLEPLLMNNRGTAGAAIGSQAGVWEWRWVRKPDGTYEYKFVESVGPNPIGLLVKVYGKVTQVDPSGSYFYIDDDARADDGTTTGDKHNYGIKVALDGRAYTEGQFLKITGVVSCYKHTDGKLRRLLRPITIE
jgi:hypothetical protein